MHPHGPPTETYVLIGRGEEQIVFLGRLLGSGTSERVDRDRWFEVDIYADDDRDEYVVHTRGMSRVPGDHTKVRVVRTTSAFDIIEVLTVNHNDRMFIPKPSARALAQAAQWDDDIRDAYINRAVA